MALVEKLRALGDARRPAWGPRSAQAPPTGLPARPEARIVDLEPRREKLVARAAELQWDLGGLLYEMAIRDHIRVDVLVQRAAALQEVDAELAEVERVLRMEQNGAAGSCASCGALHSRGAAYCWQCGHPLVAGVPTPSIAR